MLLNPNGKKDLLLPDELRRPYILPDVSLGRIIITILIYLMFVVAFALALQKPLFILLVLPLIYLRAKRTIGLQEYTPLRILIVIILSSTFLLLLLILTISQMFSLIADLSGGLCGLGLAILAVKNTSFESKENRLCFRSHIGIQTAIVLLFCVRFLYRFLIQYQVPRYESSVEAHPLDIYRDPFTAFVLSFLFMYSIIYYIYILRTGKKVLDRGQLLMTSE